LSSFLLNLPLGTPAGKAEKFLKNLKERGSKRFFFEKKNQKTFVNLVRGRETSTGPEEQKFFARFFSKKRRFLLLP
jgi:hypothetical protein